MYLTVLFAPLQTVGQLLHRVSLTGDYAIHEQRFLGGTTGAVQWSSHLRSTDRRYNRLGRLQRVHGQALRFTSHGTIDGSSPNAAPVPSPPPTATATAAATDRR